MAPAGALRPGGARRGGGCDRRRGGPVPEAPLSEREGPPILLIHGHPRTGSTWHRVAPRLVEHGMTVVCPDMRGYGRSGKAEIRPDHSQQSKREVAADMVCLMDKLGHGTFTVAGHDRGCYVALRLALDHPDAVTGLVVMDGVPISEALARCDAKFAHDWYHWFFFAQPDSRSGPSRPTPTRGTAAPGRRPCCPECEDRYYSFGSRG